MTTLHHPLRFAFLICLAVVSLAACNSSLQIDEELYACEFDEDCGPDLECYTGRCLDVESIDQKCEDYCNGFLETCSGVVIAQRDFEDFDDCFDICVTFPANADDGASTGNSLQCRLYHLGAAQVDPELHCPHASWKGTNRDGTPQCGSGASLDCLEYCFDIMDTCTGEATQFGSSQDCLDVCSTYRRLEVGSAFGTDTFECRRRNLDVAMGTDGGEYVESCRDAGEDSLDCDGVGQ